MNRLVAIRDPGLNAQVISCSELHYAEGAAGVLDRAAHVRAASSIVWQGNWLAVLQDDTNFLALVQPGTGEVRAVTLPAGEQGLRQFDDLRGNKRFKLDFEACVLVPADDGTLLLGFGSGSLPARESVLIANGDDVLVRSCASLYQVLRSSHAFAGSELNIEGAIYINDHIRLFNRGNGAPRDGLEPVNATCDISWNALRTYLNDTRPGAPPAISHITQFDLGTLDRHPLGFTDATTVGDSVLYSAAAEQSPDAVRDGPLIGSAIGVMRGATVRWTELVTPDGQRFDGKVEGLALDPHQPDQLLVVVDRDDPLRASELCRVRLEGDWGKG